MDMYDRILAVGDIHGEFDKFMDLYQQIQFRPDKDLLIFLGDYIDRGRDPLGVLEWMMAHQKDNNVIMLRGNHDQMMLDYYIGADDGGIWKSNGGKVTSRALSEAMKRDSSIRDRYLAFIDSLPYSHQLTVHGKTYFFCHAGIDPNVPLEQQDKETLLWIREKFFDVYHGEVTVVVGHSPVNYYFGQDFPLVRENMIMVDTWACNGGELSCVDVLSGRIWQSE